MSEPKVIVKTSFPILGFLGVILVTLKLLGMISISWWLVLLPFYFGLALLAVILFGGIAVLAVTFAGAWCIDTFRALKKKF